ncbi:Methyl-accepting chemotaxis protein CtpH [Acaryochloris thomasi RCC1774]|uniref:Methyl-accepting chemotaxis protein CtpH n=1 Tax=Acaryochloris thomasi RCC1774 TaxID=1764569 RepID=A0A2W1JK59_9CYAN|nr:HAMP domain-containing methyl-accepting chemotaxis protein [Acaryochloris thomasi]PZD71865.1 Methyl-accepting chemotaxis protein CtpH [Acaryochloris thomasi RCC1774]
MHDQLNPPSVSEETNQQDTLLESSQSPDSFSTDVDGQETLISVSELEAFSDKNEAEEVEISDTSAEREINSDKQKSAAITSGLTYRGGSSGDSATSYSQRFFQLPIKRKQLFATGASIVSLGILIVAGGSVFNSTLQTKQIEQTETESSTILSLVEGDNAKNDLPAIATTLNAFPDGFSAILKQQGDGSFRVISAALEGQPLEPEMKKQLEKSSISLIQKAVAVSGEVATAKISLDGQSYNVGAVRMAGQGVVRVPGQNTVVLRGLSQASISNVLQRSLTLQLPLGLLLMALNVGLALLIARSLLEPITDLQQVTRKFSEGDRNARAKIFSTDEVGELASSFNLLVEDISRSEKALAEEAKKFALASQQAEAVVEEQKQQNTTLQYDLFQLLSEVEEASDGNLTVRADTTEGQVGVVADFFNSIVESMRDVVTQVKDSTTQVNSALVEDEEAMGELAEQSRKQAQKIQRMLTFVEQMAQSIQEVSVNAQQTADVVRSASSNAEAGGEAMDLTVQTIVELRETVAGTAKKVKRLGESSQQISKAVSLINQIALQTNLLAINASIEAARAGEEGRGFAVVAEEVGALAAQSAAATKEIEQIVDTIQMETSEVVNAMEVGTAQVVAGTGQVEAAKQSLGQIIEVSRQIDHLVQAISDSTASQTQTSEMVTNLMKEVAKVSANTSTASTKVASSLEGTVSVAKQLKASVDSFKVEA